MKKTILVVEDEKSLAGAIKIKLEKNNFNVTTQNSVEKGLAYLDTQKVDLVWLDHYLGGAKTGIDFVKGMKKDHKKIPVFVVSNTASQEKIEEYEQLGITKYYTKSNFRLDKLLADIRSVIGSD